MNQLLIVDDEEGIRDIWKGFHDFVEPVFRGQLQMDAANDIEMAEHKIASTKYDAIIMDLKFKGKGSDETITFIATKAESLPPIIVLTGDEDIFVRRRCMMFGAADFWTKRDAQERPDLFFKAVYNCYLARYGERTTTAA